MLLTFSNRTSFRAPQKTHHAGSRFVPFHLVNRQENDNGFLPSAFPSSCVILSASSSWPPFIWGRLMTFFSLGFRPYKIRSPRPIGVVAPFPHEATPLAASRPAALQRRRIPRQYSLKRPSVLARARAARLADRRSGTGSRSVVRPERYSAPFVRRTVQMASRVAATPGADCGSTCTVTKNGN